MLAGDPSGERVGWEALAERLGRGPSKEEQVQSWRIAVGGIHIESSTFSPYVSTDADFTVLRGAAQLVRYPWRDADWAGNVTWFGTLHARALPGGVVARATYDGYKAELLDALRALVPLDGFLLDFHGAMSVEGLDDAEADLATAIRGVLGDEALISASMDLHGNVSDELFDCCDLLTAYRTAPHIDPPETRERAARNLVEALERWATTGERPLRALVHIPILLPGEMTSTQVEPGRGLYKAVAEAAERVGVIDVACLMGFPWADQPRCTGVVVATGTDPVATSEAAREIAARYWAARDDFVFVGPVGTFDECLAESLASPETPYLISDTGDNPGAGGADDVTFAIHALLTSEELAVSGRRVLVASLHDPGAAALAHAEGVGALLDVELGGHHDQTAPTLQTTALVAALAEDPDGGLVALLELSSQVRVIVTQRRKQYRLTADYDRLGVPLGEQDIVVVKIGYLEPELAAAARGWRMALTPGAVCQDLPACGHRRLVRPLVPFDRGFAWDPGEVCAAPRGAAC